MGTWLWWQLWLDVKPNLKSSKFSQYKAEYEEKIALAEANIDEAVAECEQVQKVHDRLLNEKNELENALKGGDSIVQDIIDKTNRLEVMKNDLQKQLDETKLRIRSEEEAIENLGNQGNRTRQDADKLRGEVRTLEA